MRFNVRPLVYGTANYILSPNISSYISRIRVKINTISNKSAQVAHKYENTNPSARYYSSDKPTHVYIRFDNVLT